MSLISDALKLTQETHSQQAAAPPETKVEAPPLLPVAPPAPDPAPVAAASPALLMKIIVAAGVGIVFLALILASLAYHIWHKSITAHTIAIQTPPKSQPAAIAKPAAPTAPPPLHHTEPAIEQVAKFPIAAPPLTAEHQPARPTGERVAATLANPANSQASPNPVAPPKLVLQGILLASQSREAMINGDLYKEGDNIDGARIVSIERGLVKIEFAGNEIILRIP